MGVGEHVSRRWGVPIIREKKQRGTERDYPGLHQGR
jgi:hypothetical protein